MSHSWLSHGGLYLTLPSTLIYGIGAGITAAAGTRLALQLFLVKANCQSWDWVILPSTYFCKNRARGEPGNEAKVWFGSQLYMVLGSRLESILVRLVPSKLASRIRNMVSHCINIVT